MSRDGSTTLDWGDDTYRFALRWAELELLQEAVDAGPWVILDRLMSRQCRVGDISHTLRCGLIGGGCDPVKAKKLVELYVEKRPPGENIMHAYAILAVALHGAPEEGVGEGEAADQKAETA